MSPVFAKTVTRIVGSVGDSYLTSREIQIQQYLDLVIEGKYSQSAKIINPDESGFDRSVTSHLLEKIIAMEAEDFSVATVTEGELQEAQVKLRPLLKSNEWKVLAVDAAELQVLMQRKLRAKKFIKYKTESASIPITDGEIKDYYEKNRFKFGSLPLSNFKENIRSFLTKQQLETSLREWFEVLNKKYKVRNFESERAIAE